jgi:hypothetical protein
MTIEYVLLLGLYAFILLGLFGSDKGPKATFDKATPRLAAKLEQDMSVGKSSNGGFRNAVKGTPHSNWEDPN